MDREQWQKVQTIFQALLDVAEEDRPRELGRRTVGQPDLEREVASLLAALPDSDALLADAVGRAAQGALEQSDPLPVEAKPARLGPYRVGDLLGEGGMSQVYEGERADDEYQQRVAIKILRPSVASPRVLQRFRAERQILARLDHPGIARILDGGSTPEGLPYLVLDLIDGVPIDRYCQAQRLGIQARLELFDRVCDVVQYAHQNLVIHRDLKPANILVQANGQPKLLDFGIAKLLDPDPTELDFDQTRDGDRLLSLSYASPEQVRGEGVTTATDVYALGVILFRLLTDRHPYELPSASAYEAGRVVCEEVPRFPSQTAAEPRLRGDLDAVVLTCLEKDAKQRYPGVLALAADIRAYLRDEPVSVAGISRGYLLRKFVKRNARSVIAAGAFCVLLVTALTIITVLGLQAHREQRGRIQAQQVAERRFTETHGLVQALLYDIYGLVENMPGATAARESLVRHALLYLDALVQDAGDDQELQRELAVAYVKIGDVQGNPAHANLGNTEGALQSYAKAEKILSDPEVEALATLDEVDLPSVFDKIGEVLLQGGDTLGAYERHRKAFDLRTERANSVGLEQRREGLAASHSRLGNVLLQLGKKEEALVEYRLAVALYEELVRQKPESGKRRRAWAASRLGLGATYIEQGSHESGLDLYLAAVAELEQLVREDGRNIRWQRDLSVAYTRVVRCLMNSDEAEPALEWCTKASAILNRILLVDPANANARRELSLNSLNQGYLHTRLGEHESGLEHYARARELILERGRLDPKNLRARRDEWLVAFRIASLLEQMGRDAEADSEFDQARTVCLDLVREDPGNAMYQRFLALSEWFLGAARYRRHEVASARSLLERALGRFRDLVVAQPSDQPRRRELLHYLRETRALLAPGADPAWNDRLAAEIEEYSQTQDPAAPSAPD